MDKEFKLVKITDSLVVHPQEIVKAERCGNYTDIWLREQQVPKQVWDEKGMLWRSIQQHAA